MYEEIHFSGEKKIMNALALKTVENDVVFSVANYTIFKKIENKCRNYLIL